MRCEGWLTFIRVGKMMLTLVGKLELAIEWNVLVAVALWQYTPRCLEHRVLEV